MDVKLKYSFQSELLLLKLFRRTKCLDFLILIRQIKIFCLRLPMSNVKSPELFTRHFCHRNQIRFKCFLESYEVRKLYLLCLIQFTFTCLVSTTILWLVSVNYLHTSGLYKILRLGFESCSAPVYSLQLTLKL